MKHPVILTTLLLGLTLFGCKKQEQETLTPKIKNDKVEVTATTATFTWTVDWPGKLISVVEVSENEDMSDSQIYGSETETENHNYTVTVTDLKVATKYYYRYLVWNRYYLDNKFVMDGKYFLSAAPIGAINGTFSVNEEKVVLFSQGNLQYQASTKTWRFAENQWDYVGTQIADNFGNVGGTVLGSDNNNISSNYNGWIDLFGWGTSGYNGKNPWMTSELNDDYGNVGEDISGKQYDWGVHNKVSNGGNTTNIWRTLTKEEWDYVINTRVTHSSIRFAKARVNNVNGVVLVPDNWSRDLFHLNNTNSEDASFDSNIISASQWVTLQNVGAVFLPVTGLRVGINVHYASIDGLYWSSSCALNVNAYFFSFSRTHLSSNVIGGGRFIGYSVRLVRDME